MKSRRNCYANCYYCSPFKQYIIQKNQYHTYVHIIIIEMLTLVNRIAHNYTSVLKGLKSFQNSPAQAHLHDYIRSEQKLKQIKSGIDYKCVNKNSKGVFMFREFLFQEKVEQNYVAPLNLNLLPVGKWTRDDLKNVETTVKLTRTQEVNQEILTNCSSALQTVFKLYYKKIGKPTYKFILQEEIGKVSKMSPEEFNNFVSILKDGSQEQ